MGVLDKGYRYKKNDLDFTLVNRDYDKIGDIHYVQALCNKCGKKVKLHRGEWATGRVMACPSCLKKNKKSCGAQETSTKATMVKIKPVAKLGQSKEQTQMVLNQTNKPVVKAGQSTNQTIKPRVRPVAKLGESTEQIKTPQQTLESSISSMIKFGGVIDDCKIVELKGDNITLKCNLCKNQFWSSKQIILGKSRMNQHLCSCRGLEKANIGLIQGIGQEVTKREKQHRELPGWIYMGTTFKEKSEIHEYRCTVCGRVDRFTTGELLNKDCSCKNCKRIEKANGQPVGNYDWIGFDTHSRRVESIYTNKNNIKIAKMRCLVCDKLEDVALISVIKDEIQVCDDCASKPLILSCPICGKNHLKNNLKGLYSREKSDIICMNENKIVPKEFLVAEHDAKVRMQYIAKKYKGKYTYQSRQESKEGRAGLIKFNEGYQGTDGQFYQTCMCLEHNKFLSLTAEEQGEYTHEFCDNDRMIQYNSKRKLK